MEMQRANIAYLLGAGASKGLGLPTSRDLLSRFPEWLKEMGADPTAQRTVETVLDRLRMRHAQLNFEDFLTTLSQLANRNELDLWPLVERLCEPLDSILRVAPSRLSSLYEIALDGLRRELARDDLTSLRKPYLDKLIDLALETKCPSIYTLNYDLSIEAVLEARSIPYANGFRKSAPPSQDALDAFDEYKRACLQIGQIPATRSQFFHDDSDSQFWPAVPYYSEPSSRTGFFELTPSGKGARLRLVKIHGSLDWYRIMAPPKYLDRIGGRQPKLAAQDPVVRRPFHPYIPTDAAEEVMIAGRWGKERSEEPYVSLLRAFYAGVIECDVIVIIGYSFSDGHINRALTSAQVLDRSRSMDIIIVNGPNWPGLISAAGRQAWELLLAAGEESERREGFSRIKVVPQYAETALMEGELEMALAEVLARRGP